MSEQGRLKIKLRRGTRELDLILRRFVDHRYAGLDEQRRRMFELLLDESDPDLMDWITGRRRPSDKDIEVFIGIIRETASS